MSRRAAAAADGERRRRELAAIHLGKRELGWDDDTYRSVLHQLTGQRSAAELTEEDRAAVLDRMRQLGFRRTGAPATSSGAPSPQILRARALWGDLAALGVLRDTSDAGLQAFGLRMTGVSRLEWCSSKQLVTVIEALKAWLSRGSKPPRDAERGDG